VADQNKSYRTKTGKVLTDTDVEALADEAEGDHDVGALKERALGTQSTEHDAPEMPPGKE
jgi:hypothetical protein